MATLEQIQALLSEADINYQRAPYGIVVPFKHELGMMSVHISVPHPQWVSLRLPIQILLPEEAAARAAFIEDLLRFNSISAMGKVAKTEDTFEMTTEIYSNLLKRESLELAIRSLLGTSLELHRRVLRRDAPAASASGQGAQ
jgi:hypothetical protein